MPPFIDPQDWPAAPSRPRSDEPRLLTVAMMRNGDKLASYRILADALERMPHLPWSLDMVGDGEAREEIVSAVRLPGNRVRFHGAIDSKAELKAPLRGSADLFVWPAVNEAYGMVLLEAQALGCPVVAGAYGGVASVVQAWRDGRADDSPGDIAAFADALRRRSCRTGERLRSLGANALRFVHAGARSRSRAPCACAKRSIRSPLEREHEHCAS